MAINRSFIFRHMENINMKNERFTFGCGVDIRVRQYRCSFQSSSKPSNPLANSATKEPCIDDKKKCAASVWVRERSCARETNMHFILSLCFDMQNIHSSINHKNAFNSLNFYCFCLPIDCTSCCHDSLALSADWIQKFVPWRNERRVNNKNEN